ncbi:MAG: UbiH/UbiF/VisC/COQ6 family ubiquinone biosynthesis hydroxylase [Pseudomonadota bacterium]
MGDPKDDVCILGGGLVGSAMALALDAQGFRVSLIDPVSADVRGDPGFDGRAYAVAPGSANLLKALGIWDAVEADAQPVTGITVRDTCIGPVPPAMLHFDPAEGMDATLGSIVEDRHLRRVLLTKLAKSSVRHLDETVPGRVTRASTGAEVVAGDEVIGASLVVACDGRRSATARAAEIRYLGWSYGQTGLVSAIEHDLPHDGRAHQAFFPGGPFAVLPLTGNRSSLVWSERDGEAARIKALSDEAYLAEIARRLDGRLGDIRPAGKRWAYPLGLSLAMDYARPRLVVAGDAAHGVHPIAGQGMNMGLRDVAALTQVLAEAARRGEDIGSVDVLRRYEQWRRFDATALALGMDALNRLFSTGAGPAQALRNIGLGLVGGLGGARRLFMAEASGRSGAVPRLLAGQAI